VSLTAENIDWSTKTITYFRRKTGKPCVLRLGAEVAAILQRLPTSGPLFPKYSTLCSADRATRFTERVEKLGIRKRSEEAGIPSISLHSYRYAWAERARAAGYPERFAQEALGHASAAILYLCFGSKRIGAFLLGAPAGMFGLLYLWAALQ